MSKSAGKACPNCATDNNRLADKCVSCGGSFNIRRERNTVGRVIFLLIVVFNLWMAYMTISAASERWVMITSHDTLASARAWGNVFGVVAMWLVGLGILMLVNRLIGFQPKTAVNTEAD